MESLAGLIGNHGEGIRGSSGSQSWETKRLMTILITEPLPEVIEMIGEPWESRTPDLLIKSQLLYLLS